MAADPKPAPAYSYRLGQLEGIVEAYLRKFMTRQQFMQRFAELRAEWNRQDKAAGVEER